MKRIRAFFRRRRHTDADFATEVESHIAIEAERLVAEGRTPETAAAEARRRFGNIGAARERHHDARTVSSLDGIAQDVRYAIRSLRRAPVFTTIAVLSLALGIGANTAVFTFVNAVLFKDLPVRDPARLVSPRVGGFFGSMDYPTVKRFRDRPGFFEGVAAVHSLERSNIAIDHQPADPRPVVVHLVTGDYFPLLGVHAAKGRVLSMDDERAPSAHPVAVISDAFWRSHFAQDAGVVGHTLTLNEIAYTIVGVAPASFTGDELGRPADAWMSVMMQSEVMPERPGLLQREIMWLRMLARVKPGVTVTQAGEAATEIYRQVLRDRFAGDTSWTAANTAAARVVLDPERRGFAPPREDAAEPMVVVWAIVALVLAIACVNVSALMLVRAAGRAREIATRLALGASARRVARLYLMEGVIIGAAASLIGAAFALAGVRWLGLVAASGRVAFQLDVAPDARVFGLTAAISFGAMLMCGLVPAARAMRLSSSGVKAQLASGGRGATMRGSVGRVLVVAQVAIALILVVGAGLFARTLTKLQTQELGFDRDHLLQAFTAPEEANIARDRLAALFADAEQRIGALPGVRAVAVSSRGLFTEGSGMVRTTVPGFDPGKPGAEFVAYTYVTTGFFETIGMKLATGRGFQSDDIAGHQRVAVVSESMARRWFGTTTAIGKHFGVARDEGAPIEVVGIVHDAKDASLRDDGVEMMYLPVLQGEGRLNSMRVIVRTDGDPRALAAPVRRILHDLAPALPVPSVEPVSTQMERTIAMEKFTALASAFFGGIALLLAGLGMFAMVSHAVAARTPEIGIRMALGGTASNIARMILRENLALVCIGLAIGALAARFATKAVETRLFGVSPTDAATFAGAAVVMILAALAAIAIPVRRATHVDPAVTLRHE